MSQEEILGIVRHILTSAGGAIVAHGYISTTGWEQVVGGLVAVVGAVWSVLQKRNQAA